MWENLYLNLKYGFNYTRHELTFVPKKKASDRATLPSNVKKTDVDGAFSDIQNRIGDLKNTVIVTDVDDTILSRKVPSLESNQRLMDTLIGLLEKGIPIALISGHSRAKNMQRLIEPLKEELRKRGKLSLMTNLILFANGGSILIRFDSLGGKKLSEEDENYNNENVIDYDSQQILREFLSGLLSKEVKQKLEELASKQGRKWDDFKEAWITFLKRNFEESRNKEYFGANLDDLDYSWLEGKDFQLVSLDSDQVENSPQKITKVSAPWFEVRDGGAQISPKVLPRSVGVKGKDIQISKRIPVLNTSLVVIRKEVILR